jgi:DNA-binding NtrC family response regulator
MLAPKSSTSQVIQMSAQVKILIVDDEAVVRQALVRVLSSVYCSVEAVANGADALRRMRQERFDLVLLDLRMPGIDGMAVLEIIKRDWPECEVVIVTGHAGLDTAKESVALGAFAYVPKPVGPNEVIAVAHDALLHKGFVLRREPAAQVC